MPDRATSALTGKRIAITRNSLANAELAAELHERHAIAIHIPLLSFSNPHDDAPLDDALTQLDKFDWLIFTSAEAVRRVVARSKKAGVSLEGVSFLGKVAAVGPGTAKVAKENGIAVNFVAEQSNGLALANELGDRVRGQTLLLPRSDRANPGLPAALRRNGANVTEVIAYRTLPPTDIDIEKVEQVCRGESDAILFFSPSAVEHFVAIVGARSLDCLRQETVALAIGSVTAAALHNAGARCVVMSSGASTSRVIEALEEHFSRPVKALDTGAQSR